jgi:hypothetical protein
MSDKTWRRDLKAIRVALAKYLGRSPQRASAARGLLGPAPVAPPKPRAGRLAAIAVALAIVVGVAVWRTPAPSPPVVPPQTLDVTFLIPPKGSPDAADALAVFTELKDTLGKALPAPRVMLVPEKLTTRDLRNFRFDEPSLLSYKTSRGPADLFIQTTNNVDPKSNTRRLIVTPLQRSQPGGSLREIDGWPDEATFEGPAYPKFVAVRAAFELFEFLSTNDVVQLTPAEKTKARLELLSQYQRLLGSRVVECSQLDEVNRQLQETDLEHLAASAALSHKIFQASCPPAPLQNASLATAGAIYGAGATQ